MVRFPNDRTANRYFLPLTSGIQHLADSQRLALSHSRQHSRYVHEN